MKTQHPISDNKASDSNSVLQLQSFKSAYIIPKSCECFISSQEIARTGKIYYLVDFFDDETLKYRRVIFFRAYQN